MRQFKVINLIINNFKHNNLQGINLIKYILNVELLNIKNKKINEDKLIKLQELIEQIKMYQPKNKTERKNIEELLADTKELTRYLNLKTFW